MMRIIIFFIGLVAIGGRVQAQAPDQLSRIMEAQDAYTAGRYAAANAIYLDLINKGFQSPDILYNLGNTYFRMDSLARAILAYERALRLDPTDSDISYNLEVTRSHLDSEIAILQEFFLARWWQNLRKPLSPTAWFILSIVLLTLSMLGLSVWLISNVRRRKKYGFVFGVVMIFLSFLAFILAASKQTYLNSSKDSILMKEVVLRYAPDKDSRAIGTISPGIKLRIIDTIGEWYKVQLTDKSTGWLRASGVERI